MADVTQGNNGKTNARSAAFNERIRVGQTGENATQRRFWSALSVLRDRAVLLGLDTAEMEELSLSGFTETEISRIRSTSDLARTLTPIFASLQRSGMTVSERFAAAADAMNAADPDNTWYTRRDARGRTYLGLQRGKE